jgi:hypothetical protein
MAYASELLGYISSVLSDFEGRELARGLELDVQAFMRGQREGRLIHAEREHDAVEKTRTRPPQRSALRPCPICDSNVHWDLFERCSGCDTVMHHVCYYGRVVPVDEWRSFLHTADSMAGERIWPKILCPACRGRALD